MDSVTQSAAGPNLNPDRANKKDKSNSPLQNVYDEKKPKSAIGTANSLGEDELALVIRNVCLTTRDLLNFRFVSTSWCNAATSTLLQRDACFVSLVNEKEVDQNGTRQISSTDFFKIRDRTGILTLTQLRDVMSQSRKFPASHLRIFSRDLHPISEFPTPRCGFDYSKHADLHAFFQLHGAKVKTFQPCGTFALGPFLAYLSSYAPNVECLNFDCTTIVPSQQQQKVTANIKLSKLTSRYFSVKSLVLNRQFDSQTIHLLLSALPNLNSITNIHIDTLPRILNEGKGHLIRSFQWERYSDFDPQTQIPLLIQFMQLNPQLSKIKLGDLKILTCFGMSTCLSALLEASKESLQELKLFIQPYDYENKLKLCCMKQLQCIIVRGSLGFIGQLDMNDVYSIFHNGMSAQECFPSLVKLRLSHVDFEKFILQFFQFQLPQVDVSGTTPNPNKSSLPNVQVLEIDDTSLLKHFDSSLVSQFLPNLRVLNIDCLKFEKLSSSFWLQFSRVESLEIGIKPINPLDGDVSSFTDMFFTGFSPEMCSKLRTTELSESLNNAQGLKSLRISPSVCDLQHLKELKLKVSPELCSELTSRVTGVYAFSQMPKTKFIISYDLDLFKLKSSRHDGIDYEEMCFGSIKPYVQIVHDKFYVF